MRKKTETAASQHRACLGLQFLIPSAFLSRRSFLEQKKVRHGCVDPFFLTRPGFFPPLAGRNESTSLRAASSQIITTSRAEVASSPRQVSPTKPRYYQQHPRNVTGLLISRQKMASDLAVVHQSASRCDHYHELYQSTIGSSSSVL
jgi:hypothetical protein